MNPTERLNRVRAANSEMSRLLIKVEELENLATRTTPVLSQTPKGEGKPKDETWAMLIDYKEACKEQLEYYITSSRELTEELNCIRSSRIRTAMKCRYVDCMKIDAIADMMHYDPRSIYTFLKKGKKIYCEVYDD